MDWSSSDGDYSQGTNVTDMPMVQPLGLMGAAHPAVFLSQLHMRRLQRWFVTLHLDTRRHKQRLVTVCPLAQDDNLFMWTPLGQVTGCGGLFEERGRRYMVTFRGKTHQPS